MRPLTDQADAASGVDRWIDAAQDRRDARESLGAALEACRRYLLLVADRELGSDLRPKASASDLVQETFLEAKRDFERFQGRTQEELKAWLRRILRNNLANLGDHYRATAKRRLSREVSLDNSAVGPIKEGIRDAEPSASDQALRRERAIALGRAVERLPEHYRRVIDWRHRQGCSFEEIGRRLDNSADAARKVWMRALRRLQDEMGAPDGG